MLDISCSATYITTNDNKLILMKTLEIIITILVCSAIMFFVVRQSQNLKQEKTHNEKVIEEFKKKYQQGGISL